MSLPDVTLPAVVARLGRALPGPARTVPFVLALELVRRAGWLQPPAALEGRRFLLKVDDLGLEARFQCRGGRFRPILRAANGAADLTLSADSLDYLRLILKEEDSDSLFFRRRLRVEGDTELGLEVKYWLDAAEQPPWLEKLALRLRGEPQ